VAHWSVHSGNLIPLLLRCANFLGFPAATYPAVGGHCPRRLRYPTTCLSQCPISRSGKVRPSNRNGCLSPKIFNLDREKQSAGNHFQLWLAYLSAMPLAACCSEKPRAGSRRTVSNRTLHVSLLVALDYFTYCEVSLVSAHCDAQASEGGHAGVSRCCE
jgi:hypothetical protein